MIHAAGMCLPGVEVRFLHEGSLEQVLVAGNKRGLDVQRDRSRPCAESG